MGNDRSITRTIIMMSFIFKSIDNPPLDIKIESTYRKRYASTEKKGDYGNTVVNYDNKNSELGYRSVRIFLIYQLLLKALGSEASINSKGKLFLPPFRTRESTLK
jgi:hypothetical protein